MDKRYKGEIQVKAVMSTMRNSVEVPTNTDYNGIQPCLRLLLRISPLLDIKAPCFAYILLHCTNAETIPIQVTQVIKMGFEDIWHNDH